jgi:hypothetical protein
MAQDLLQQLALALYGRLNEAVYLERAKARVGPWEPQMHYCHENVRDWVKYNPQHKHVFGFVFFDLSRFGYVEFQPHSVIEMEDGTLVDITPHQASDDYPFLRHTGSDDEFAAAAAVMRLRLNVCDLSMRR